VRVGRRAHVVNQQQQLRENQKKNARMLALAGHVVRPSLTLALRHATYNGRDVSALYTPARVLLYMMMMTRSVDDTRRLDQARIAR